MDKPEKQDNADRKPDGPRKGTERRGPVGGNALWYMIAILIGTGLLTMWFNMDGGVKLDYSEYKALLKAMGQETDPAKRPDVKIKVTHDSGSQKREYFYWDPREVVIDEAQITGKIKRQPVDPHANEKYQTESFQASRLGFLEETPELSNLHDAAGVTYDAADPPSGWKMWMPTLVMTALIILVIFIMMRRLGGAGSPMAFGRSRGKLYAQEDLGVTFNDVAGIDEAVEEVREVVDFLRTPEKYQALGGRIPKGVLLVGPPGTGKTLLAKAIAGEAGVPFFSLSGSDFVEMFVGVGAARVRDMFQQAEAKAPCIIFIDELDALGKSRGTSIVGGHDEREQTLNALLVEMDGFDSNSGVIVMAATNRPETLDPALLRPGRFDRHVLVDRPDIRGREAILKVHVKNVKLDADVDLKRGRRASRPASSAPTWRTSSTRRPCSPPAKARTAVGMDEFNEGVERVTAGLEKKQRIMHEDEKQRVAYHESGHALVAYCLPNTDPVHKVSIIPRGSAALGYTMQRPEGRPLPDDAVGAGKPHPGAAGRHDRRGDRSSTTSRPAPRTTWSGPPRSPAAW